jgi:hypothetical protein
LSLYSPDIQRIVKTTKCPYRGFVVDVVEHQDYLELRVYKDNIESFSEPQKVVLADYLYKIRDAIKLTGTKCFIQGSLNPVPYGNWRGN